MQKTLGRYLAIRTDVDAALFAVLPIGDFNEGAAGGILASALAVIPFGHDGLK